LRRSWLAIGFLVAVATGGFMAAPWWVIVAGAFGIACQRVLHQKAVMGRPPATWVIGVFLVSDVLWCAVAYAAGRALAAVIA
jgi:hypothetical protein